MSVKFKLLLSYIAMFIVPIILTTVTVVFVGFNQLGNVKKIYDLKTEETEIIQNPFVVIRFASNTILNELKSIALTDPQMLEDNDFVDSINNELLKRNSFLVIKKNDDLVYVGNSKYITTVRNELPRFGNNEMMVDGNILIGEEPLLARQQDFYYKDGSQGSFFLITDAGVMIPAIKRFITKLIMVTIIILATTNSCLTIWMSRSIITPLKKLKEGANNIKEGNLDFSIETTSDDEIGELCTAFEEMRVKLKESIDMQMQYEEDRKELITNISHDLKTPITAIKGYVEGIMDGVADNPEKMDKYIKTIYTKANDLDKLIEELFLFSKLDLNKLPFEFSKININDYMGDCIEELSLDLEKQGITLTYESDCDSLVNVIADSEQLKRVIVNIINNSAKYINKSEGRLSIRLREKDSHVQIEINDNGKGIAKKDIPYVFNRFYRTDSSRNSTQGGTGLGLSIAKKIIEEHGGEIWLDSEENVGTTICFTLKKA